MLALHGNDDIHQHPHPSPFHIALTGLMLQMCRMSLCGDGLAWSDRPHIFHSYKEAAEVCDTDTEGWGVGRGVMGRGRKEEVEEEVEGGDEVQQLRYGYPWSVWINTLHVWVRLLAAEHNVFQFLFVRVFTNPLVESNFSQCPHSKPYLKQSVGNVLFHSNTDQSYSL